MDTQQGFDFGQDRPASSFCQPAGTWLTPEYTRQEHAARLDAGASSLAALPAVLAGLYGRGIEAARTELERLASCREAGEAFDLHCAAVHACTRERAELLGLDLAGLSIERKGRRPACVPHGIEQAIYVPGVGTLTMRAHMDGSSSIRFEHYRSAFMLGSFRDHRPVYELPRAAWSGAYASQAIAEAGGGVARVRTFRHGGREWINDGGAYFAGNAHCEAWALVRRGFWDGETYSYDDLRAAWDAGTLERGDRRGLVVKVRAVECVLAAAAFFTDYAADGGSPSLAIAER